MTRSRTTLFMCALLVFSISFVQSKAAVGQVSPAEKLVNMLPDDVVGFVATSGGDSLKPAFEKTILGRIWNDTGVKTFRETIKKELTSKAIQEMPQLNDEGVNLIEGIIRQVTARPFVIGVVRKQTTGGPPLYGFAILDAGPRKAELVASLTKLESFADEGDIIEVEVGSVKLHGPKDAGDVPVYWGWVGDYFVFVINDGDGLAIKYLQGNSSRPAPVYLKNVPGSGDALAAHIDFNKLFNVLSLIAGMEGGEGEEAFAVVQAVIRELGLNNVSSFTERVGFDGPDIVSSCLLEMPEPRTGLVTNLKQIDLSMFDMADPGSVSASAANCDIGGVYDTIMKTARTVIGGDFIEVENAIAAVESELNLKIRQGLLESLSGPMLTYVLPGGASMQSPQGGFVIIAGLKDAKLWEESMTALGTFATKRSEGMIQVSSQVQDGRTVHTWAVMPLAMAQIMPSWTVVNERVVIGSNMATLTSAINQINSGTQSIRGTDGFKKVTANLPANLISFKYGDSKLQFTQLTTAVQQFWPMATMFASKAGLKLPFVLPQLSHIAQDMGPSCQYSWFDIKGLRMHYRGAGVEPTLGVAAGGAVGAGIMLPAMARAREQARNTVSMSNLKQLGLMVIMYADEHDGKLPDNLEQANIREDSGILKSPLKPKDFDGPSYIYVTGQKMNTASAATQIIAYENPEYCKDTINVLFLDGHVEKMQRDRFREMLEATYKELGKEMPEI